MPVEFHAEVKTLLLTEPFRIAHGESFERQVLRVHAKQGDMEAVGEAPFVPYYPDDPSESMAVLKALRDPLSADEIPADAPRTVRLALDLLRADLAGKRANRPMHNDAMALMLEVLGPSRAFRNSSSILGCRSFSIPVDLDAFAEKVRDVNRQFSVLKLKLGSGNLEHDELIVARARNAAPNAKIFADANGGWTVEEAALIIPEIKRWNLEFIEQPISHKAGVEGWRELRGLLGRCKVKLFADEGAQCSEDVMHLKGLADGVNVKLLKCGSWDTAKLMILCARACGMKVMLGCMIESSIGTTAAAHLAPLADWIDLDGHLYVANDDYEGIQYDKHGRLVMPATPGIGAIPVQE